MAMPIRLRATLLVAALFSATLGVASASTADFGGTYALADAKADRAFLLEVKQDRSRADVSFSAAMEDGSGSAPEAEGKGRIDHGVLSFRFKDSFQNEGTCTLETAKSRGRYALSITVLKVVDPTPFHFYGTVLLKKTSP
jgi:hypothetical protein